MTALAERPTTVGCVGSNHVPGCDHFPRPANVSLQQLPLELVDVGANIRVDPGELEELAATIRAHGVLQPVRAIGPDAAGRYRLVWGQRRLLASRLAGLPSIPALVEPSADDAEPGPRRSLEQLVENIARRDLNPVDEARALAAVLEAQPKLTQAELAKRLGRSAPWLANALALLRLDQAVQARLANEELTAAHARAIGGLAHVDQAELAEKAIARKWSAHELERQARWAKDNAKGRAAERERMAKIATEAVAALEKAASRDATVVVQAGAVVAAAIRKAGWPNVRTDLGYGAVETIKNANSCGCKAWIVDGYSASRVAPACIERVHIAERRQLENERWEREREESQRKRATEDLARVRRAEGIGTFLAGVIDGLLARRLILYALLDGGDKNLVERYLGGDRDAAEDRDVLADELWAAVLAIPDDKLTLELGQAVGDRLLSWGASKEVLAVIDAVLPPAKAKPVRKAKAAKAAIER